jgi:hypothetical protein
MLCKLAYIRLAIHIGQPVHGPSLSLHPLRHTCNLVLLYLEAAQHQNLDRLVFKRQMASMQVDAVGLGIRIAGLHGHDFPVRVRVLRHHGFLRLTGRRTLRTYLSASRKESSRHQQSHP